MRTARRPACCTCRRRTRGSRWSRIRTTCRRDVGYNLGIDFGAQFTYYRDNPNAKRGFVGYLQAIDPVTGKQVWKGETNEGPTGGALATAGGLVFQGGGSSQEFRAYDAKTGEKLWSTKVQTGIVAPPISFELDGQAVHCAQRRRQPRWAATTRPNYSRMLVFGLGGKKRAAARPSRTRRVRSIRRRPPRPRMSSKAGDAKYAQYCAACHGENGQTRGANFPDLTRTPLLHAQEGFDAIVLGGGALREGHGVLRLRAGSTGHAGAPCVHRRARQ